MAVGFPYSGGLVFAPQKDILRNIKSYYGAITGIFGIIYDSKQNFMGSEIDRNNGFFTTSGRSILAEDDNYYYSICFTGNTGTSGLTGSELYNLCLAISPTMKNAICFDGGGSVFQRYNGVYNISTNRLVKNAVLLFAKEELIVEEEYEEEPISFAEDDCCGHQHEEEVQEDVKNPLDNYTDEQLAELVLKGIFGSGDTRKEALGDRYNTVQTIVNLKVLDQKLKVGSYIRVRKGAKDLTVNKPFLDFVYNQVHVVHKVLDDRVVFGTNSVIIGTISKEYVVMA
jgi:hypothetical protein